MPLRTAQLLVVLMLPTLVAAGCTSEPVPMGAGPPTSQPSTSATPRPLEVATDPAGRPYDTVPAVEDVEFELLGQLVVPDGEVRVMNGNSVQVDPAFFADEATSGDFDVEVLDVTVVWEPYKEFRSVLGILLEVPDTEVARWGNLEYAYGTDGGVGGITTQSVIDRARQGGDWPDGEFLPDVDYAADVQRFDADHVPGEETVVFSNGYGDGAFPMVRGFSGDDRLVALFVYDPRHPWRLLFPDQPPPADVTAREEELLECLAGTRTVDEYGFCETDS